MISTPGVMDVILGNCLIDVLDLILCRSLNSKSETLRVSFNAYCRSFVDIQVIYRALTRQLTTWWYFIIA
jgi:hypothetical protein